MYHKMQARGPVFVVINKKEITSHLVDFSVPTDPQSENKRGQKP